MAQSSSPDGRIPRTPMRATRPRCKRLRERSDAVPAGHEHLLGVVFQRLHDPLGHELGVDHQPAHEAVGEAAPLRKPAVSTKPGRIVWTRIPRGSSSLRADQREGELGVLGGRVGTAASGRDGPKKKAAFNNSPSIIHRHFGYFYL